MIIKNNIIIGLSFCDLLNNHSLSVINLSFQVQLITLSSSLIFLNITKTSFNNLYCYIAGVFPATARLFIG